MSQPPTTPQPGALGRRGSKPSQHGVTFSATSPPSRPSSLRNKSRTFDTYATHEEDDGEGGPSKGGHSLRKRTRVNYKFEQIEDQPVVPNSSSVPRGSRKSVANAIDDAFATNPKARRHSFEPDTPSSRRRNTSSRRSQEITTYHHDHDEDEDPARDTIEVGIIQSDSDGSDEESSQHSPHRSVSSPNVMPSSEHMAQESGLIQEPKLEHISPRPEFKRIRAIRKPSQEPLPEPSTVTSPKVADAPTAELPSPDEAAKQLQEEAVAGPAGPTESLAANSGVLEPVHKAAAENPASAATISAPAPAPEATTSDDNQTRTVIDSNDDQVESPKVPPFTFSMVDSPAEETFPAFNGAVITHGAIGDQSDGFKSPTVEPSGLNGDDQDSLIVDDKVEIPEEPKEVILELQTANALQETIPQVKSPEMKPIEPQEAAITPLALSAATTPRKATDPLRTAVRNMIRGLPQPPKMLRPSKPQPTPTGRWSGLTPYIDGEYLSYPERTAVSEDGRTSNDDKGSDKDSQGMEPMVEDNEDVPDVNMADLATPALNTPTRGSPAPDVLDSTTVNSPMPAVEDTDEVDTAETQEPTETKRCYDYRKLRDADEFINAIGSPEKMSTEDLHEVLEAVSVSLVQWQTEFAELGKIVDDHENAQRRREADSKYQGRLRNNHRNVNYEEPDLVLKGYRVKQTELFTSNKYLQSQDRLQAILYGFEYDPHPTKIGNQDPESQQSGIVTRGRSLRNQPKQTAKASEADEVTGKRQRKPAQLFDPAATQDVSRANTPVPGPGPGRGRRRRDNNDEGDDLRPAVSFDEDANSDAEGGVRTRRKRGPQPKQKTSVFEGSSTDALVGGNTQSPSKGGRRGRPKQLQQPTEQAAPYEGAYPFHYFEQPPQNSQSTHQWGRKLTLKLPPGLPFTPHNGESRPGSPTAGSDQSSHTAESSYSFRPKRQKRFRDEPDDLDDFKGPPKKRGKRVSNADEADLPLNGVEQMDVMMRDLPAGSPVSQENYFAERRPMKIKLVKHAAPEPDRTAASTPGSNPEENKDYKAMTKSEKMSASMKSKSSHLWLDMKIY